MVTTFIDNWLLSIRSHSRMGSQGMPLHPDIEETYLRLGRELAKRNILYIHLMDQSGFKGLPKSDEFRALL